MIKLKEPLLFHQAAKYNDEQLRSLWQIFCDYPEGDHCVFGKHALQVSYTNVADNSVRINKGAFGIWIHDESKDKPRNNPRKYNKDFLYIGRSDKILIINLPSPPLSNSGRKDYIILRYLKTDVYIMYTGIILPESDYILATITREAGRNTIHPDDIKDDRQVFEYAEPDPIKKPSEPGVPKDVRWILDNNTWKKNDRLVDIRDEKLYKLLTFKFDKDAPLEEHFPEHGIRVIQLKNIEKCQIKCKITNLGSILSTLTHNIVLQILGVNAKTGETDLLFDNIRASSIQTTIFQPSHFRNVEYTLSAQTSQWYTIVDYRELYVNAYLHCRISNYPGFTLDSTEIINEIDIIGKVERRDTKEPLPKPPKKPPKEPPKKDPPPEKKPKPDPNLIVDWKDINYDVGKNTLEFGVYDPECPEAPSVPQLGYTLFAQWYGFKKDFLLSKSGKYIVEYDLNLNYIVTGFKHNFVYSVTISVLRFSTHPHYFYQIDNDHGASEGYMDTFTMNQKGTYSFDVNVSSPDTVISLIGAVSRSYSGYTPQIKGNFIINKFQIRKQ